MVHTPEAVARQEERTERRRQQVLDAAEACFVNEGFHSASINRIAVSAGMSAGHIYKLFENKEAIIEAIVERDTADLRQRFDALRRQRGPVSDNIAQECSKALERSYDPGRAALMLEIVAEAARNARVADIVRNADAREREMGFVLLQQAAPHDRDVRQIAARGEVLEMLFDGMAVRSVCNPGADRAEVAKVLDWIVRELIDEVGCARRRQSPVLID